jgi:hypothetical protein
MSTKSLVIAFLWVVAIILFALVGFDVVNEKEYDLVAIGLALTVAGFALDKFWAQA